MSEMTEKAKEAVPLKLTGRVSRHVSEMLRLAPAIVLARSGVILIVLVDTVMVGHHAALELGYLAMGMSLMQPLIVTSLGLIMGTLVLSAHHFGAGELENCGRVWRCSIAYATGLGVIGTVLSLFGETYLTWTGQSEELAREGGKVMLILGLGLPGHLLFLACSFFLEGIRRPTAGFVAIACANLVNLALNWVLIGGGLSGLPDGAMGAALATSVSRWLVAAAMIVYVLFLPEGQVFGIRRRAGGSWSSWKHQRRLGYATGVSLAVESGAFTTVQQFAGWLGPIPLAAFTAAFYMLVVSFMVAIGFGAATTVRVGNAHGRRDIRDMALAGWTGLGLTVVVTGIIGVFLVAFDKTLISVFTDDPAVAVLAVPLVFWVAAALISDGGQAVMASALRGRQDVWTACYIQTFAFIGILVPLTWYLVFPMGMGSTGIFQGVLGSTVVTIILLSLRFYWLYRRDLREEI